ncbi:MAG: hypothetical protein LPL00_12750 [Alphaproteobacteria bacterium]|nr:hypothetical protein [Alphaproteobacteria bacterium]MDX5370696.1 hypothetical protein [Alphaproteobacteria bacterium]MDX5465117.1 hypothetical protein [Alphaproteobacteria bacterium]
MTITSQGAARLRFPRPLPSLCAFVLLAGCAAANGNYPRIVEVPPVPAPAQSAEARTAEIADLRARGQALDREVARVRAEQDAASTLYGGAAAR